MTAGRLEGYRVLVVEDEALLAMDIQDALEPLGCEIAGPAATVEDALLLIEEHAIDGALMDINLGGGRNSYPIAEALAGRGIPFAFLTGYGEQGVSSDYSGTPVLSKPFDEKSLVRMLSGLLGSDSAR